MEMGQVKFGLCAMDVEAEGWRIAFTSRVIFAALPDFA
jgi:hypothetical protein